MKYRIVSELIVNYLNKLEEQFYIEYKVWGLFWKRYYVNKYSLFTTDNLEYAQKRVKLLIELEQMQKVISRTPPKIYEVNDESL